MSVALRDYTFLGRTQSLCPECLTLVPAKIVARQGRVYFRKRCPTHGAREDYVCSDVRQYDRLEFSVPGRLPEQFGLEPDKGCPYDCGLCSEHEQHTCVGLVEITTSCNLHCPMCFASSGPGGSHLSVDECKRAIDRLVEVEGRPEILQLSGGEPTIHPQFAEILDYACRQPIDVVMINTNGLRLAHDPALVESFVRHRQQLEVYLQFDGFSERSSLVLRGESLVAAKLRAIELLGQHGIRITLVCTLQPGVNDHEIGEITRFGLERPWITGISFQPATYSGRHVLPADLEKRITFPDVVRMLSEQTDGLFRPDDFLPLPCAHPNCHSLAYAYRAGGQVTPLMRFIDAASYPELFANGITFTRPRARRLIEQYLGKLGCCADGSCDSNAPSPGTPGEGWGEGLVELSRNPSPQPLPRSTGARESATASMPDRGSVAEEFFVRGLAEKLSSADVFRVIVTSFLDAYNFDVRRLMKCCIHHVLPSGHVIPFCAYNVLYRNGHVPLPQLAALLRQLA